MDKPDKLEIAVFTLLAIVVLVFGGQIVRFLISNRGK